MIPALATHQSPLPSPRARPFPSFEVPAAAEAKLDVNGEGMVESEKISRTDEILQAGGSTGAI